MTRSSTPGVNHFEQYWATSCDGQRPRPRSSAGPTPEKRSEVKRRPQTTSGRQDTSPQRRPNTSPQGRPNASPQGHPDTSPQGRPNASPQGQPGTTQGRPVTSHEGRSKSPTTRMRGRSQTRQESRGRYLSCQRVTSAQLQEIVTRLTRDTTAHKVKCAPNPHVWVDTSPGAHMVRRRQQAVTSQ
ncbi:circumsporozoite protein-like [Physella acuta]|uniref:circumsporozoite protein-like n=1 Tax=Physella acuta TaxID=109671 RepID=UPI0027DD35F9|nr:circumsporozoite protein-like [Physella acuta]XP_059142881.1 circumsporozoite protein-like [Physella acuta]XP_059142890.1 circumsporozoite protein-like [Physella acuta]XP_059142899.1 circumsporozoite protein-like [Physella acuta]XP_059142909.1 circumsporozoite protein-like [Physella acuta]